MAQRWMTGDTHSQISISPRSSSSASVGPFDVSTPRVGGRARRSMDIRPGVHWSVLEVGARLVGTKDRYRGNNPSLTPYAHLASRIASKLRFFANDARHCFSNLSFWPTVELDFSFSQATVSVTSVGSNRMKGWFKRLILVCRSFPQLALFLYVCSALAHYLFLFLHHSCHLACRVTSPRRTLKLGTLLVPSHVRRWNAHECVCEMPDLYDHTTTPCALTSPQSTVNAHLTISHRDNPLYVAETIPPTPSNDSTDVRLACAPEARKLTSAKETQEGMGVGACTQSGGEAVALADRLGGQWISELGHRSDLEPCSLRPSHLEDRVEILLDSLIVHQTPFLCEWRVSLVQQSLVFVELDFSAQVRLQANMREGKSLVMQWSNRMKGWFKHLILHRDGDIPQLRPFFYVCSAISFSILLVFLLAVSLLLDVLLYNRATGLRYTRIHAREQEIGTSLVTGHVRCWNAREWVREFWIQYTHALTSEVHPANSCALRRPQPAVNAHLTVCPSLVFVAALTQIWPKDNPLYAGETTPPTLMNDSTNIRVPEARKPPSAMETQGGDGRRRVHMEWREVSWSLGFGACRHYRSPGSLVPHLVYGNDLPSERGLWDWVMMYTPRFSPQRQHQPTPLSGFNFSYEPALRAHFKFSLLDICYSHP
ncbi:hypothetical protein IW261DRAFT_1572662 [Armillaria novae-zelandiae]|uniref:Uncharacterized protein n=1 Tax=Armillaria novae-zelandiae TaxID=153914 RepID=A0AA39T812_9AGAR|nr:hypothetical protein IW261DRAFT_1572662 [Armillaria novae-zelandiae]